MSNIARPETVEALQMRAYLATALYQHFGWQEVGGQWVQGSGREIPATLESLSPRYHKFYERVYVGGKENVKFFENQYTSGEDNKSNFFASPQPAGQFYIVHGVSIYEAQGASASDNPATLAFGVVAEDEIENANISFTVNGSHTAFEKQPIRTSLDNSDTIGEYLPLAVPVVWEPNKTMLLELESKVAIPATNFPFLEVVLHGTLLKSKS